VTVTGQPTEAPSSFYTNKEDSWFWYEDPPPEPDAAEASASADNADQQRHQRVPELEVQAIGFLIRCTFVQPNVSPRVVSPKRFVTAGSPDEPGRAVGS
jgi:hypothetical protein